MLVLTRRPDRGEESTITIGEGITITVVDVRGDQVRLGVQAPADVEILRRELYDARQEQQNS